MRFAHAIGTLRVKSVSVSVCILALIAGSSSVAAFVPVPPPKPPVTDPIPAPSYGPAIPYISGRLGGVQQAPTEAPSGAVVPDDFCLPGKFEDCGDHLRDQSDLSPAAQDGPVFVNDEDTAFSSARFSGWISGQSRQTEQTALSEQRNILSFSVGGDRQFGDRSILGAMAVSTDTTKTFALTNIEEQAVGFLAGPYFAFLLSEDWVLDGRFLAGNANHSVLTAGVPTGSFEGFETFGALRLSGSLDMNQWLLHPSIEIANLTQSDDAYNDTLRGNIAASNTSETFVTAAVLAYHNGLESVTPYVGIEASSAISSGGDLFGVFRAGVAATFGSGAIFNVDYAYGAIGLANVNDQQISLRLEIPF